MRIAIYKCKTCGRIYPVDEFHITCCVSKDIVKSLPIDLGYIDISDEIFVEMWNLPKEKVTVVYDNIEALHEK